MLLWALESWMGCWTSTVTSPSGPGRVGGQENERTDRPTDSEPTTPDGDDSFDEEIDDHRHARSVTIIISSPFSSFGPDDDDDDVYCPSGRMRCGCTETTSTTTSSFYSNSHQKARHDDAPAGNIANGPCPFFYYFLLSLYQSVRAILFLGRGTKKQTSR